MGEIVMHSASSSAVESDGQNQNVRFYRSIQSQVMLWTMVLGLVPLIIMGAIAYGTAQNALHEKTQAQLEVLVANNAEEIEKWFEDTLLIANSIAQLPTVMGDNDPTSALGWRYPALPG